MKTVLIFVMGSDAYPYPELMQASRETWDSFSVGGTMTHYFSNILKEPTPRTLQIRVGGDLHDMGHKCLFAYQWALGNLAWDYMARVNASCYVSKAVLLDHVQSLPETGLMRGLVVPKERGTAGTGFMWGGAQFIMSRDVVQKIADNSDKWDHREMEDVSVSRLTEQLGIAHDGQGRCCSINEKESGGWTCITYNGSPSFEFTDFREFKERAGDQFFIRVKQDLKRDRDIFIMRELRKAGV